MQFERLETRMLLAADLLSASMAPGRAEVIQEAPQTETVDVSSPLVESTSLPIADTTQNIVQAAEAPTRVAAVVPAAETAYTKPVVVKANFRKLAADDGVRAVSIRFAGANNLVVGILKQRVEPTVRPANDKIAKAIDQTLGDQTLSDRIKTDRKGLTTQDEPLSLPEEKALKAESSSIPQLAPVLGSKDASDSEAAIDQPNKATDAATSAEASSMAPAIPNPGQAPLRLLASGAGSAARSIAPPFSTTSPAQLASRESSGMLADGLLTLPIGEQSVRRTEPLPRPAGAMFAVALGAPLARFALAADLPGVFDGRTVYASRSSSMSRVRSRRRGKERPMTIGMVDDLPTSSPTERFTAGLTVATETTFPERREEQRQTTLPRLVNLFVAEPASESDRQASSRNHQAKNARCGADESQQTSSQQAVAAMLGGSAVAVTIAMLAYERVSHFRSHNRVDNKTRPLSNATTRDRGES